MKPTYLLVALLLCTATFSVARISAERFTQGSSASVSAVSDTAYTYKTIQAAGKTWGYDIYKGSKRIIHQLTIPGISGIEGFKLQSDAEKVAELVISKLRSGEMPPGVSREELINLKVLK